MTQDPLAFHEASKRAIHDPRLKQALGRIKGHFQLARRFASIDFPEFEALRSQGAAIREYSINNLHTLLSEFESSVTAHGGKVHWARTASEACQIVTDILKLSGARRVTKGKSMVSEEIGLNEALRTHGIDPVETDLGEYIIQLRHEPPSHIIAPAFHLNKEDVADTFRGAHKALDPERNLSDRSALVSEARVMLRAAFESADAGITGANFLTAREGAALIVTNEGNGDLTRLLPRTHIVVTGIEKIVPDLDAAAVLLRLLTRSATGQPITSYVSVMSGPHSDEMKDGPREFHVVLVDNGRTRLLGTPAQATLRCIRCAACLNHCPIYGAVGGHAYGATYPGPIGAALNPNLLGISEAHHHPNASTFCGRCAEVCPVKIPLPTIMRYWRAREYAAGLPPFSYRAGIGLWAFAAKRPVLYRLATRLSSRLLKLMARNGRIRALPLAGGWFAVRDLPQPEGKTFLEQWRAS
ncbi:MAG: lactate utilization protein [Alphaproteobacteria bacterium]|nr:lactate utilization protein [Alphaproteobacteria bacterium]